MIIAMSGALSEFVAQNNFGDTRSGSLAGPVGLVIILLLAIATFLLIRNMNQRLKRLPERFPSEPPPEAEADEAVKEGTPHNAERRGGDPS